jgi:hypothetical protein
MTWQTILIGLMSTPPTSKSTESFLAWMQRRKLNLKATFESSFSIYGFERFNPGAFNVGLIG